MSAATHVTVRIGARQLSYWSAAQQNWLVALSPDRRSVAYVSKTATGRALADAFGQVKANHPKVPTWPEP